MRQAWECSRPGNAAGLGTWQAWERGRSGNEAIRMLNLWCHSQQEVTEQDELILMYRFYYHMDKERYSPNIN